MNRFIIPSLFLGCIISFAFFFNSPSQEDEEYNHFKVWQIDSIPSNNPVLLKDLFYPTGRTGDTEHFLKFANPVKKTHGEDVFNIIDSNYHLSVYNLSMDSTYSPINITIKNQLEAANWVIKNPQYLLVPTEKFEDGSSFPTNENHYVCYHVFGFQSGSPTSFELEDQYDVRRDTTEMIDSIRGRYFCVPVDKNNEGIPNEFEFLTWYDIFPQDEYTTGDYIDNQFDSTLTYVTRSCAVLVPTDLKTWSFE